MEIPFDLLSKKWDPIRQIKTALTGPYRKIIAILRFLTIYNWRVSKIHHDLICVLIGKQTVAELRTCGNRARFREFEFEVFEKSTQLEEIVNEVFVNRIYEGFGARISDGDVILDCGANIGLFTLYATTKIGSKGKIICIEPIPDTYRLLTRNVLKQPPVKPDEVVLLNLALSGKKEKRIFMYSEDANGSATGAIERFEIARGSTGSYRTLEISCMTMDDIVFDRLNTRVDFIKMDTEGMEKEIIAGGKDTIRKFKPRMAISPHIESRQIIKALKELKPDYRVAISNNIIYAW